MNDKVIMKEQLLCKRTDWNWYAPLPFDKVKEEDEVRVNATAWFANGEKAQTESSFTCLRHKQVGVQFESDWKNLLGNPQHIGTTTVTLKTPLRLAWTRNVGANLYMCSPLTDKEIIFGSAKEGLVALDNETLEPKWNFKTSEALIYTAPYSRKASSTIETSPIQVGKLVFIG